MNVNKNKISVYKIFFTVFVVLALVMAGAVSAVLYFNYDDVTQFTAGTLHTVLMALIFPVFGALGAAWAITLKKMGANDLINSEKEGNLNLFSKIACVMAAVSGMFVAVSYFTSDYSDPLKNLLAQPKATAYYAHMLSVVLAVCAALAFVSLAFGKNAGSSPVRQLPLVGFLIFYLVRIHTDMSLVLMSTRRMICVFAVAMLLLFLMAKIRVLCYKQAQVFYLVSGVLAAVALISSGVSALVLNLTGVLYDGIQISFYLFEATLGIYVLAELSRPAFEAKGSAK